MASGNLRRNLLPALSSADDTSPEVMTDTMAVPERRGRGTCTSRQVYSDVHKGRPCTSCTLCKDKSVQYTHPVRWKDETLYEFLQATEPNLHIPPDACICRNCRDSLSHGHKNPENYNPRWSRLTTTTTECEIPGCTEPPCRRTKLASKEEIRNYLQCPPLPNSGQETNICDKHYRALHKLLNPVNYQWKCAACSIAIRGSNSRNFRACADPDLYQKHLMEHTNFEGKITASDKVCMGCYRHSLTVTRPAKVTTDEDLKSLIGDIKDSMTSPVVHEENQIIEYALKLSAICIAQQLLSNQALTLQTAHEIFKGNTESLGTVARTPRWLLGQLSVILKHHLAYTCRVKKHGTILYRQGRELDCLSQSLFTLRKASKPDHTEVCADLNNRLQVMAGKSKSLTGLLDIEQQVRSMDPLLWDMVCILTQSARERKHAQVYEGNTKNLRRLFILHQLLYCMDNTCSMPFHVLTADLIDCHAGSSELIRIFNQLGICVSYDTLLRHIQGTVQHLTSHGLLHSMNYKCLTVFTMDNIDFMHSYAQVFSGNQQLSWHGTTLQAIQSKPSTYYNVVSTSGIRRKHALLSPMNSPDRATRSPVQKKTRARTGTEFSHSASTATTGTTSYNFSLPTDTYIPEPKSLSIENFRLTVMETSKVDEFMSHATSYCLLQSGICDDKKLIGFQSFFSIATKAPQPEVGIVKYVQVLDEIADSKDTILHIVSELHAEYICKHNHKYLVLEGDAKTYQTMQDIKYEYGRDLSWLIPYPGDWHLLKNYQICLMKPFFEAGLKDLAVASSYPPQSIQNCSQFKRTHHFLMEVWETLLRCMIHSFLADSNNNEESLEQQIASTLKELEKGSYDELAVYSVIRGFTEGITGFDTRFSGYVQKMSDQDDIWKFWSRFVFEDCKPYVTLFMALRSENWHLRTASIKSMAADFTAFDHPCYQKLIGQHIVDILNMPRDLLEYFEKGGFVLSITGNAIHSVALDESHEMLINKHVKQAITRPSKDYITRIAQYIPFRVKTAENLKSQLFHSKPPSPRSAPIMFAPDKSTIKSAANIQCLLQKVCDGNLFPHTCEENRGLTNPFRELVANSAQREDLLNFNKIGRENFELRIKAYVLKLPSVKVPQRRKKLQTFTTPKKAGRRQINVVQQELKRVQKCMRRKIAHANKTGTNPDVIGEQYIEFPRALCTTNGLPVKGQKSITTHFYQARYKDVGLITHTFPTNWIADSVILEGMFLINTKPLHCHKIMGDYGNFLMHRFIVPHLKKGSQEVHLLFDDPGRQSENPKVFEQSRRDTSLNDHTCFVFFDDAEIPVKWQSIVKCRMCKRKLTTYLSDYFTRKIRQFLTQSQKYVTSGATDTSTSVRVTKDAGASTWATIESRVDESDTRLWLHLKHSVGRKKFILSPDTDVYHIGLPLVMSGENVLVQLSLPSDKELKVLNLNALLDLLKRDPDLVHIPDIHIPRVVQTLFVATGCDYVSFFSGIGKAYFLKVFFEYSRFIAADLRGPFVQSITHANLVEQATASELVFVRLVGCAYFKKHANAFHGHTPSSLMNSFSDLLSSLEQHQRWLDHIRQTIWDRISAENETIPSFEALHYHWLRSCWVLHTWQQAQSDEMVLAPLHGNGWVVEEGVVNIVWDTPENMQKVKQRVRLLMNGCGCKTGCTTGRCGCQKRGSTCGAGCHCVNCTNTESSSHHDSEEDVVVRVERSRPLCEEIDELMNSIFGADSDEESDSSGDEITDRQSGDESSCDSDAE